MTLTSRPPSARQRIGAFQTIDGAARAVSHLVELDYDPDDVAIAPRDFVAVEPEGLGWLVWQRARRFALLAAIAVATVGAFLSVPADTLVQMVAATVVAALIGGVAGIGVALARRRRPSSRAALGLPDDLRPSSFEVVVDRYADEARHDLARWWDPESPPVRDRRVA